MSDAPYETLSERVDQFHIRVSGTYPEAMNCGAGCSSCCHQHLSVVPLEWERIRRAVESLPAATRDRISTRVKAGRADARCPLLGDDDRGQGFEARPMSCRSHGLPIQVGEPPVRDVCPLNFTEGPAIEDLESDLLLDVERVNQMRGLMCTLEGHDATARVDLIEGLSELLSSPGE